MSRVFSEVNVKQTVLSKQNHCFSSVLCVCVKCSKPGIVASGMISSLLVTWKLPRIMATSQKEAQRLYEGFIGI